MKILIFQIIEDERKITLKNESISEKNIHKAKFLINLHNKICHYATFQNQ